MRGNELLKRALRILAISYIGYLLPVTYTKFAGMMEPGDTLYVGRYLVSGADSASLYLEVSQILIGSYTCKMSAASFVQLNVGRCVVSGTDFASLYLEVRRNSLLSL